MRAACACFVPKLLFGSVLITFINDRGALLWSSECGNGYPKCGHLLPPLPGVSITHGPSIRQVSLWLESRARKYRCLFHRAERYLDADREYCDTGQDPAKFRHRSRRIIPASSESGFKPTGQTFDVPASICVNFLEVK